MQTVLSVTRHDRIYTYYIFTFTCMYILYAQTHCNKLQHTATHRRHSDHALWHVTTICIYAHAHCNTRQHTTTHCDTLQHSLQHSVRRVMTIHEYTYTYVYTHTHCNTLHHTASLSQTRHDHTIHTCIYIYIYTHTNTHTATYCNTLHHTAVSKWIAAGHDCSYPTKCTPTLQYAATHCNIQPHTATHRRLKLDGAASFLPANEYIHKHIHTYLFLSICTHVLKGHLHNSQILCDINEYVCFHLYIFVFQGHLRDPQILCALFCTLFPDVSHTNSLGALIQSCKDHVTHANELCHTSKCVMSYMWMSGSCHNVLRARIPTHTHTHTHTYTHTCSHTHSVLRVSCKSRDMLTSKYLVEQDVHNSQPSLLGFQNVQRNDYLLSSGMCAVCL